MSEFGSIILCEQGFKNVWEYDAIVGFQLRVRISYYRAVPLCLLRGYEITVDGEKFGRDKVKFSLDGKTFYTLAEMASMTTTWWPFGDKAYLQVEKPGGLSRGIHKIHVTQFINVPYLPYDTDNNQGGVLAMVGDGKIDTGSKIRMGVSLYSYQDEFARRDMTLRDCIQAVSDIGADGVEIIPDEMLPNWRNGLSDEFYDNWFGWMDEFGTRPIGIDAFADENALYKAIGRRMDLAESIEYQKGYVDLCAKLGCFFIRFQGSSPELTSALVPYAEEKGITLGLEVHAPGRIGDPRIQDWLELKAKLNTNAMGIIPDFGIWETQLTPVTLIQCRNNGLSDRFIEYANEQKALGVNANEAVEKARAMGATDGDVVGIRKIMLYGPRYDDPENLRAVMPHIISMHGKFFEMTDDLQEASIDYENPIRVLVEEGYDKYICSEYEGGRHVQEIQTVRGVDQVRRQHAMIRNCIEKAL